MQPDIHSIQVYPLSHRRVRQISQTPFNLFERGTSTRNAKPPAERILRALRQPHDSHRTTAHLSDISTTLASGTVRACAFCGLGTFEAQLFCRLQSFLCVFVPRMRANERSHSRLAITKRATWARTATPRQQLPRIAVTCSSARGSECRGTAAGCALT